MKLAWMILANHAEDSNGLLIMTGAAWDTVNVNGPPEPPRDDGAVAVFMGFLVIRTLFHATETGRAHEFTIIVMDEDGSEVAKIGLQGQVERKTEMPTGWDQGINILVGLTGMPLPKFGTYEIVVHVDGQHVGDLPFRVVKAY